MQRLLQVTLGCSLLAASAVAQAPADDGVATVVQGMELRGIGPAMMGGRIADIAIDPRRRSTWYVAVGSGGVWKTVNAGITFTPIFDQQASYSIGCVALDPTNPDVLWVGTGENVSGRHVGWGDGVYRSRDGGKTFTKMGLAKSEHVSRIVVDPRDNGVVWVAAEGPLWSSGGDRGLYRSADHGKTWKRVLHVDADTGVTDVRLDPRNPDVVYAASYQRRRHIWSLLGGGPGSGIHKSTDGGKTWRRIRTGLPKGDVGKIGLAVSPKDPDVVYATIEAGAKERGFYRSLDCGESWQKRNGYISGGTGPHYYQEIVASPHDVDTVYQMDVFLHVTRDGGKTFDYLGNGRNKHSDNHAFVIDPKDPKHLIAGTDASIYESYDDGATWRQTSNLPISQFYKVAVSDQQPFYDVLGGAQDLGTLLGPARTNNTDGVRNRDWYVPLGADGYGVAFEPGDPNTCYMEIQQGELYRYHRATHELVDIKPQPKDGEPGERWNWDAPLLVSPHAKTRIYFGSQRLWRSDDRGNSWRAVSPDLTRNQPRYAQRFMGRVWSVDSLHDTGAMSKYGTTTTISESPRVEGLLYVGTDDGRIQVSENGGGAWRAASWPAAAIDKLAFINDLQACRHDDNTVFVAIDAHKVGDYRPWVYRSRDRGRTWQSIRGDLPHGAIVWAIVQDHEVAGLLFAGTEQGLFVTIDGGAHWHRFAKGVPMISFRDLAIQRQSNDIVGATFGRGIYVLDDYTPLRQMAKDQQLRTAVYPVRDAWWYVPYEPMQARFQPSLGSTSYRAKNPPFGALLSYAVATTPKTAKQARHEIERAQRRAGGDAKLPDWATLRAEDLEQQPYAMLTIRDAGSSVVRRIRGPVTSGYHRVHWDLRRAAPNPIALTQPKFRPPWVQPPNGPLVAPGFYSVELALVIQGRPQTIGLPQEFEVRSVPGTKATAVEFAAIAEFQYETSELLRKMLGLQAELQTVTDRMRHLRPALDNAPRGTAAHFAQLARIDARRAALALRLSGDPVRGRFNEAAPPSILGRVRRVARVFSTREKPTTTQRESLAAARAAFAKVHGDVRQLVDRDLPTFEQALQAAGATWTPGQKLRDR